MAEVYALNHFTDLPRRKLEAESCLCGDCITSAYLESRCTQRSDTDKVKRLFKRLYYKLSFHDLGNFYRGAIKSFLVGNST